MKPTHPSIAIAATTRQSFFHGQKPMFPQNNLLVDIVKLLLGYSKYNSQNHLWVAVARAVKRNKLINQRGRHCFGKSRQRTGILKFAFARKQNNRSGIKNMNIFIRAFGRPESTLGSDLSVPLFFCFCFIFLNSIDHDLQQCVIKALSTLIRLFLLIVQNKPMEKGCLYHLKMKNFGTGGLSC